MKNVVILVAFLAAAGCSSQSAVSKAPVASAQTAFAKKLEAMPVDQRAAYARAHLDEATAAAGIHPPAQPR